MSTTISEIRQEADQRELVRKIRRAVAFIADTTVELPEQITTEDHKIIDLKEAGWTPFGLVSRDGYTFNREVEKSQVDALGYMDPVRKDVENIERSVELQLLQWGQRKIHELVDGADYSGIRPKANGEIVYDEPDIPFFADYRMIVIGEDGRITNNWIMGNGYGLVQLGSADSITWNQESSVAQAITLDVLVDPALGSPKRNYLGGSAIGQYHDVLGWGEPETAPEG
ncbi:hypothetical protein Q7C18_07440 [Nesterenkonia sp. CL21]|uniref:hypothetical protein n=1 Tax=Nesterenkonia sp. CL21 TaxID=3064894 RepID=UPI00287A1BA9|nr:hypothetical protein [Nesterenkonia sp. CL21]MDS2172522.1 hypothetical protein [Nesterenkonia sp. CL21]